MSEYGRIPCSRGGHGLLPQPSRASGARMSVWAGMLAIPTGQVTPLGPWLQ